MFFVVMAVFLGSVGVLARDELERLGSLTDEQLNEELSELQW